MKSQFRKSFVLSGTLFLFVVESGSAILAAGGPTQTIPASSMTGLRSLFGNPPIVLDFGAVKYGTEDRTVAHFPVALVNPSFSSVTLNIPVRDIDPSDPAGEFDIYAFHGDGTASADEFNAGTFYTSISGIGGGYSTPSVDVTPLVVNALSSQWYYLSFVFRQHANGDRFDLYPDLGGSAPIATLSVSVVPEPTIATLLLLGILGCGCRRHR